jgi:rare lipoprotein A
MRQRIVSCVLPWIAILVADVAIAGPNKTEGLSGLASVYDRSSGKGTASGEQLREDALTAAHRTLPFGTIVAVTDKKIGRSALVRINDRGPFVRGRVIDLTSRAARALGISGLANVSIAVVSAPKNRHFVRSDFGRTMCRDCAPCRPNRSGASYGLRCASGNSH